MSHTFRKAERLTSRKTIQQLFDEGHALRERQLRLLWLPVEEPGPYPAQVLLTAPKRNFPKAVDRNRVKRLLREAWRLQKSELYQALDRRAVRIAVIVVFSGRRMPSFADVQEGMGVILSKLIRAVEHPEQGDEPGHDRPDPDLPGRD